MDTESDPHLYYLPHHKAYNTSKIIFNRVQTTYNNGYIICKIFLLQTLQSYTSQNNNKKYKYQTPPSHKKQQQDKQMHKACTNNFNIISWNINCMNTKLSLLKNEEHTRTFFIQFVCRKQKFQIKYQNKSTFPIILLFKQEKRKLIKSLQRDSLLLF